MVRDEAQATELTKALPLPASNAAATNSTGFLVTTVATIAAIARIVLTVPSDRTNEVAVRPGANTAAPLKTCPRFRAGTWGSRGHRNPRS